MKQNHRFLLYAVLAVLFAGAFLLYYLFRFDPSIQFQILTIAVLAYLGWGLTYHWVERTVTREVMIEYLLIGTLVLIILFALMVWR